MASTNQAEKNGPKAPQNSASDLAKAKQTIRDYLRDLRNGTVDVDISSSPREKPTASSPTAQKILKSARIIFIQDGHAGLSLRKVADHAGLSVGNLSYHFPTKKTLIHALLNEALLDYIASHLALFGDGDAEPIEILQKVVQFYVTNARVTHGFFYQLWGFAGSSEEARTLVRDLYRPIGRFIYYLVRASNQSLSDADIRRVTLQIFSLEEGYKLFIGLGSEDDPALASAEVDIRELTRKLVMGH